MWYHFFCISGKLKLSRIFNLSLCCECMFFTYFLERIYFLTVWSLYMIKILHKTYWPYLGSKLFDPTDYRIQNKRMFLPRLFQVLKLREVAFHDEKRAVSLVTRWMIMKILLLFLTLFTIYLSKNITNTNQHNTKKSQKQFWFLVLNV